MTCIEVSIHAPARGATASTQRWRPPPWVQFTRPRGARLADRCFVGVRHGFNSRAREGRDSCRPLLRWCSSRVSIHAPARGATADILPLYCAQGQEGNPRIGLSKGARQTRKSAMSIFNDQSAENNVPTPRTFQSSHVRPRFAEERMDTKSQCVQGRSVTRICVAPSGTSETGASPVTRAAAIGDGGGSAGRPLQAALNVPHPA